MHSTRTKILASIFTVLCLYQSAAVLQSAGMLDAQVLKASMFGADREQTPIFLHASGAAEPCMRQN